jgi:hypothetical protein
LLERSLTLPALTRQSITDQTKMSFRHFSFDGRANHPRSSRGRASGHDERSKIREFNA